LPLLGVTVASSRRVGRRVLDAVLGIEILLLLLKRLVVLPGELVPAPYQIDVPSRGRNSPLGFLLENMEHVDYPAKVTV
jgi:hypothetical protein